MRRPLACLIPILLLVVFGVALSSVAFESISDFDHYDGDEDDAGHVGKIFSHRLRISAIAPYCWNGRAASPSTPRACLLDNDLTFP
jgi:hypothetical protein